MLKAAALGALSALFLRIFVRLLDFVNRPPTSSTSPSESSTLTDGAMDAKKTTPISKAQLAKARGENSGDPIYIAVKDPFSDDISVFDVSSGLDFYGPGSGYHLFTGRDATYGLATSSLDADKQDGDLSTLTAAQSDAHVKWYEKYISKYPIVGVLVDDDADTATDSKKDA